MLRFDETQLSYATPRQLEVYEACVAHGSSKKAAEALGIHPSNVRRALTGIIAKAAIKGYSPSHDMTRTVPDTFSVKGVSTYYNKDGKPSGQWVKSRADDTRREELVRETIAAMVEDLPRAPAREGTPDATSDRLLAVYPIGDAHIGMKSSSEETNEEWNLEVAETMHCATMDRLVSMSPACDTALVLDLGDFMHYDNMTAVTSRSGAVLDTDCRYAKMAKVAVKTIRRCIESALSKHKYVKVMCLQGNHNDVSSIMMSLALANTYENEPRVSVDLDPSLFKYFRHGKVLLGAYHGHTAKGNQLPGVMAADRAEDWGATTHRYWLVGHIHTQTLQDYPGVTVESFRTLAAKDAWAQSMGYRSPRDMKAIIYHTDHGEVIRLTVNPNMLN